MLYRKVLRNQNKFGSITGSVLKFALISTNYNKPLDFTDKILEDSYKSLVKFDKLVGWFIHDNNGNKFSFDDKETCKKFIDKHYC